MHKRFNDIFTTPKTILGMLHLTGSSAADRLEIARRETETLIANGIDGLIVENYFGDKDDVRNMLEWLERRNPAVLIGLNVLGDHHLAFDLARQFRVDFIQMDSVAGHLPADEDKDFADELLERRGQVTSLLFGGVRFKYQPVKSGRTEAEDLTIGKERCDAIVVTGDATGQVTELDKVRRFRAATGDEFPLLIGAGLTADNAREQLLEAEGAIVGSYFKDSYVDTGIIDGSHVFDLMKAVKSLRAEKAAGSARVGA